MVRIAVNTRLLVPDKMDGIGRFTYETLKIICEKNPNIEFTFIFDRDTPTSLKFPRNVNFKKLSPPARHPILWIWWFEFSLKNYLNKNKFDLFLSPEGWVPPKLNCPSLAVIHDLNFVHSPENIILSHRLYLKHFFPKFAKRASRIATVSEYSKNDIATTYGINAEEIDVLYNGANNVFKPVGIAEQENVKKKYSQGQDYFIFIGTIHPRKNLEHLFLAFEQYKSTGHKTKLLIAGNKKWWPEKLENIYKNLTFKDDILFVGRQSDENLSLLLSSAIALTYLPYFEGFGIPILEAFHSETAVITSNVTSMPEVAGNAALLIDPKDVNTIAKAMQEITENKTLRETLIEKGKLQSSKFSWSKSAELLYRSIQKTLKVGT
ncbi:MAG: glycosyltransferase family 1 protein [Bacteroidetes bacterium]|nr:MAG: glycosyltransferase family 1 protein [Bacteroidota bacterium]MBL1145523.1 glycosyltransferase family 1 protein [Bacteroidota bacterium]NOG58320.1 glycosyltransferase family 4 protein [Bacteroidota bacterium]